LFHWDNHVITQPSIATLVKQSRNNIPILFGRLTKFVPPIKIKLTAAGLQQVNWEVNNSLNETCYIDTDKSIPCGQGNLPAYGVAVESVHDISATIKFASEKNLRLVIKNTGHDYLGRSTGRGALAIWTHKMQNITFSDDFKPYGSHKGVGTTVTIDAGVQLAPLYYAVAQRNQSVVIGMAHSVGAAGGYIQGGGHSPMGNLFGQSTDNVVEFKVVTAKVITLITALIYRANML
jgi:FAD/FMN-containing dehydrogenase